MKPSVKSYMHFSETGNACFWKKKRERKTVLYTNTKISIEVEQIPVPEILLIVWMTMSFDRKLNILKLNNVLSSVLQSW